MATRDTAPMTHWTRWIAAFEHAAESNDWASLSELMHPDAQYHVTGCPFACSVIGRDAVLAAFERSLGNFDAKFDTRIWTAVGTTTQAPNAVSTLVWGTYEKAGAPPLRFPAHGLWVFDDEGLVVTMIDRYDMAHAELQQAFAWLAEYGEGMDPSYV